jgi:uncharacterized membrane protein HdeD (DUF308 family)
MLRISKDLGISNEKVVCRFKRNALRWQLSNLFDIMITGLVFLIRPVTIAVMIVWLIGACVQDLPL